MLTIVALIASTCSLTVCLLGDSGDESAGGGGSKPFLVGLWVKVTLPGDRGCVNGWVDVRE